MPPDAEFSRINIPDRWSFDKLTHEQAVSEVGRLGQVLARGADALTGLYLRICDLMRQHEFTDAEIRAALAPHFPPPRVSEFIIICHAPQEIYRRYRGGVIGFRATLGECRGYRLHSDDWLKRRKIRRIAERLITLMGCGSLMVCGKLVEVKLPKETQVPIAIVGSKPKHEPTPPPNDP